MQDLTQAGEMLDRAKEQIDKLEANKAQREHYLRYHGKLMRLVDWMLEDGTVDNDIIERWLNKGDEVLTWLDNVSLLINKRRDYITELHDYAKELMA